MKAVCATTRARRALMLDDDEAQVFDEPIIVVGQADMARATLFHEP